MPRGAKRTPRMCLVGQTLGRDGPGWATGMAGSGPATCHPGQALDAPEELNDPVEALQECHEFLWESDPYVGCCNDASISTVVDDLRPSYLQSGSSSLCVASLMQCALRDPNHRAAAPPP